MRMKYSFEKDKRGMDVSTAVLFATESGKTIDLSALNSIANKARDQSWKIGDQAMNKAASVNISPTIRGCSL
jgi:hypothetical protein